MFISLRGVYCVLGAWDVYSHTRDWFSHTLIGVP
jgi:hypothetical protein